MITIALIAVAVVAVLAAVYARYVIRERRTPRAVGRLKPLDVTGISAVNSDVLFLGRSGEYSFYLTWRGIKHHRSLVGRDRSRKLFGLFRV